MTYSGFHGSGVVLTTSVRTADRAATAAPWASSTSTTPGCRWRDRPHQRRLAARPRRIDVRAGVEQQTRDVRRPHPRRRHQRRLARQQRRVGVGPRLDQPRDHGRPAVLGRRPQRRHPEVVGRVRVGAGVEQQARGVHLVPVRGPVQRRRPVALTGGDVGPPLDQRPHRPPVGAPRGVRQRLTGLDDRAGARHESGSHEQSPGHASTNRCATFHQHPRLAVTRSATMLAVPHRPIKRGVASAHESQHR